MDFQLNGRLAPRPCRCSGVSCPMSSDTWTFSFSLGLVPVEAFLTCFLVFHLCHQLYFKCFLCIFVFLLWWKVVQFLS